jgi:murein endopeptidase
MRLHVLFMLAPLVIASDAAVAAQSSMVGSQGSLEGSLVGVGVADAEPIPRLELPDAMFRNLGTMVPEEEPSIELDEVRWTAPSRMRLTNLAMRWGVQTKSLLALNPELDDPQAWVEPDMQLVVYRADPDTPPQSIGAPNSGRLRGGIPLPEGPYWKMRDHRPRAYGTAWTVESLVKAFTAYGEAFPDGPLVHMGEISARGGGRVRPHVSHRSGRDVDIGYILRPGALGDRHWAAATEETFDAEKNWFLIKALIDTGRVQTIFMSSRLQRLLVEEARKELSEEELAPYFRHAQAETDERPMIVHWKGHRDHMHVRFKCNPEHRRCQPHSRY